MTQLPTIIGAKLSQLHVKPVMLAIYVLIAMMVLQSTLVAAQSCTTSNVLAVQYDNVMSEVMSELVNEQQNQTIQHDHNEQCIDCDCLCCPCCASISLALLCVKLSIVIRSNTYLDLNSRQLATRYDSLLRPPKTYV
ncbi:MAG: hypothetical protein HRU25_16175 [Psychrobium sp.]|nr:hypothetical protein [Psychrobium sp.]